MTRGILFTWYLRHFVIKDYQCTCTKAVKDLKIIIFVRDLIDRRIETSSGERVSNIPIGQRSGAKAVISLASRNRSRTSGMFWMLRDISFVCIYTSARSNGAICHTLRDLRTDYDVKLERKCTTSSKPPSIKIRWVSSAGIRLTILNRLQGWVPPTHFKHIAFQVLEFNVWLVLGCNCLWYGRGIFTV